VWLTAQSSESGGNNGTEPRSSFYGNSTPQQSSRPQQQVNNVRVYNGGAPVGFVDTPSNIHPIASLTPYQNRSHVQLLTTVRWTYYNYWDGGLLVD